MTKRIARVATLLAMIVWSWIPPQPALAQLLPPLPIVSSLIVTVTASWGLDADGVVAPKGGDPAHPAHHGESNESVRGFPAAVTAGSRCFSITE